MIIPPQQYYPLVRTDATAEDQMAGWMRDVSDALNPLEGVGSPQAVVFAPKLKQYFDTVGLNMWLKTTDETLNTGWKQLT